MKKVVILVPAYNCEKTIFQTLESLQGQGMALERVHKVIVADDGSQDRTLEVARNSWRAKKELEFFTCARNRGEYINVNDAVARIPQDIEWFLIMHGDNLAKPGWLGALLDRIEVASDHTASISTSWDCLLIDRAVKEGENDSQGGSRIIAGGAESVRNTLAIGCWWHISSCAIRLKAFRDVGGLPLGMRLKGDWDLLIRLLQAGWDIEYIPRALMIYRMNPYGSSSLTFSLHDDIKEIMMVIRRHHRAMPFMELVWLHLGHSLDLDRRIVKSLILLNFRRLLAGFKAQALIFMNLSYCLFSRIK